MEKKERKRPAEEEVSKRQGKKGQTKNNAGGLGLAAIWSEGESVSSIGLAQGSDRSLGGAMGGSFCPPGDTDYVDRTP